MRHVSLCLIFDLDGTLVDSEPLCSQAFLDLLPQLDDTVPRLIERYRGVELARILSDLSLRLGQPLDADFVAKYRSRVAQLYDTSLAPMPGAQEMLSTLSNPKCVASNGPIAKAAHGLHVAGLASFFDRNVFSSYEVGHWKPEPHLFLHAARAMKHPPERCLVIEDSAAGIQAAEAAGMKAVHFSPLASPRIGAALAQFNDLRQLPAFVQTLAHAA